MSVPRLKAKALVQSIVRRAAIRGSFATVLSSGDDDAGAVYIKVMRGRDDCLFLAPSRRPEDGSAVWLPALGKDSVTEAEIETYLARERRIDPDLWVVEIEDRDGWNPMAED